MKKIIAVTLITLSFILGVSSSQKAVYGGEDTCPQDNGWTKIDSDNLSTYPVSGATQYCFKAGSDNSNGCTGGLFTSWPQPDGTCGLSHWSYYINPSPSPSPSPSVSPSPSASPSPSPSASPDPSVSPSPSASPETSPDPTIFVGLGKNGPTCTSNTFTARLMVKANGVGQSGIKVTFNYKSDEKTATTNANGEAAVDFEFKGNGKITAKSDGYPTQQIGVEGVKDCSSTTTNGGGSTGEVLGASTQSQGQVLGAMAPTGNGLADVMNLVFGAGAGLIGLGMNTYAKKNR